ncbi:uncharacterized protein BDW43DRAFT_164128 [Aspergillus alliaceus]|uniref:uncharacterized protein n=1 Tax=Petromyces alliaceus TaxID=209559 RepID=UPI0012A403E3|nr:uncharacterized protein BDW43DRAFT_164128 [Aspergillus alliaceus]KAB8230477.1 hypothetical protein BDW43DRAFT_164128 [Aspergillus alliaceus]
MQYVQLISFISLISLTFRFAKGSFLPCTLVYIFCLTKFIMAICVPDWAQYICWKAHSGDEMPCVSICYAVPLLATGTYELSNFEGLNHDDYWSNILVSPSPGKV